MKKSAPPDQDKRGKIAEEFPNPGSVGKHILPGAPSATIRGLSLGLLWGWFLKENWSLELSRHVLGITKTPGSFLSHHISPEMHQKRHHPRANSR